MKSEVDYVEAIGRNPGEEKQHSHLYFHSVEKTGDRFYDEHGEHAIMRDVYTPMCIYGWNRSDGERLSIFRGHRGARGLCKICQKRSVAGLPAVIDGRHKTKWL